MIDAAPAPIAAVFTHISNVEREIANSVETN